MHAPNENGRPGDDGTAVKSGKETNDVPHMMHGPTDGPVRRAPSRSLACAMARSTERAAIRRQRQAAAGVDLETAWLFEQIDRVPLEGRRPEAVAFPRTGHRPARASAHGRSTSPGSKSQTDAGDPAQRVAA